MKCIFYITYIIIMTDAKDAQNMVLMYRIQSLETQLAEEKEKNEKTTGVKNERTKNRAIERHREELFFIASVQEQMEREDQRQKYLMLMVVIIGLYVVISVNEVQATFDVFVVGVCILFTMVFVNYKIGKQIFRYIKNYNAPRMVLKLWSVVIIALFGLAVLSEARGFHRTSELFQRAVAIIVTPFYAVYRFNANIIENLGAYAEIIALWARWIIIDILFDIIILTMYDFVQRNIIRPIYDFLYWIVLDVVWVVVMGIWDFILWFWNLLCIYVFYPTGK